MSLFDIFDGPLAIPTVHKSYVDWRPPTPPDLSEHDVVYLDLETNGLRWWAGDLPVGVGMYLLNGSGYYLPFGHEGPGNLDSAAVKEWAFRELRGKHVKNHTTKFDINMFRAWGVDLVEQGCTFGDVAHDAALLDDHRKRFSLEVLCEEFLPPEERKVRQVDGITLDPTKMWQYPAGMVAVRAMADARQVALLDNEFRPRLEAEELLRTQALENACIAATCEMEWNGAPIDQELLARWDRETILELQRCCLEIYQLTGLRFSPDSSTDWSKLFRHYGITVEAFTATGKPSFTDEALKPHLHHPAVALGRRAEKLADLRSKYITKLQNSVGSDGKVRYALHQLRSDEGGTVQGRYSSSAPSDGKGVNIQQQLTVEKQEETYGLDGFIIRELFVEEPGLEFFSADAMQIEYRLFADKVANPAVLAAYRTDPLLSFHRLTHEKMLPLKPDLRYKPMKNLNFATIYGAGLNKQAYMMEFITKQIYEAIEREYEDERGGRKREHSTVVEGKLLKWFGKNNDPRLAEAKQVKAVYDEVLPEAQQLLDRASDLARIRGFVRTILGRRIRFPKAWRLHKALNGVIQGSAADILKQKLVEVHRERKTLGFVLRHTEHDEICGGIDNRAGAQRLQELLDTQSFNLKVPILWETAVGANWKECA